MKQKLGFLCAVLLLSCLLAAPSFAEDAEEEVPVGTWLGGVYTTDIVTYIDGAPIASYNIGGTTVVSVSDLAGYGFQVEWDPETRRVTVTSAKRPERKPEPDITRGTMEGNIKPGDITFFRLQSTSDNILRAYIAHGEVLPVATRSFGAIGIFAIPEMGRFYRHVLIEKNFPHHGAVAFGHYGKALYEVFKYIGVPVDEIGYNQPKGVRYPTENPWG